MGNILSVARGGEIWCQLTINLFRNGNLRFFRGPRRRQTAGAEQTLVILALASVRKN